MKHYIAIHDETTELYRLCAESEADAQALLTTKIGGTFDVAEVGNTQPGEVLPLFPDDTPLEKEVLP